MRVSNLLAFCWLIANVPDIMAQSAGVGGTSL